jgi:uncharacterized membrane protein YbhN (UPF0104 family)
LGVSQEAHGEALKLKKTLISAAKILVTVGIFVSLFGEFGGGPREFPRSDVASGAAFYQPNPAMPGFVGKMKAKIHGTALPDPLVPLSRADFCTAAAEGATFARTSAGQVVKLKGIRHCENGQFDKVLAGPDTKEMVPFTDTGSPTVWMLKQGAQRVPMNVADLWESIRNISLAVFLPWFCFAVLVKALGIFANIYRWKVLLDGQNLKFDLKWLTVTYFVGRFFGIVMPSTIGLDGWRLYDTIRITRKPVECTTVLAVERVIGLVGLLATILLFMPFANLEGRGLADLLRSLAVPLGAGMLFALLLLLKPEWLKPLVRFVPFTKIRKFIQSAIESVTAYSTRRSALVIALLCAIFGQITTMLMYFGNAMALSVGGVTMVQVLYASAVMTLGTFLVPSAAGEGVRELIFVELLGGHAAPASAFLIGHLGFWIEKFFLSVQGGWFYIRAPQAYKRVTAADLARLKAETEAEQALLLAGGPTPSA